MSAPHATRPVVRRRRAARTLLAACLAASTACGDATSAPTPATDEAAPAAGVPGDSTASDEGAAWRAASDAPDLVLVVIDTLRSDKLSVYGYARPTSPGLEQLATRGVVFDDVTSQSSWTLPSMASMLSGRHVFVNAYRMPNGVPSLAERLRDAGYETSAFVANFNIGRENGFARGFEHFVNRDDTGGTTWDAFDLESAVSRFLDEHPRDGRPRFTYLHFLDPHWPYTPKGDPPLAGQVVIRDDVLEAWTQEVLPDPQLKKTFNRDRLSILKDLDLYDKEIVNVDTVLTRLLPRLTGREHLVVLAADHGETLWDRRHYDVVVQRELERTGAERSLREVFFRDHAYHLFQELVSTPLMAEGVDFPHGLRVDASVENVDIVPTFLRAAGLPVPGDLEGRPLQDVAAGRVPEPEAVYAHSNEGTVVRLTASDKKLIFPTDTGFSFGMPIMEFDLRADPHERHNLYDASQRGGSDLETLRTLMGLRQRAVSEFDLYDDEPFDASASMLEKLKELGYVGPAFGGDDAPEDAAPGDAAATATDDPPKQKPDGR